MIKDAAMRNKAMLIDGFIRHNVDDDKTGFARAKADGSIDLETRLTNYVSTARNAAIDRLAEEEGLPQEALRDYLAQYELPATGETGDHTECNQREKSRPERAPEYPQTRYG